MARYLTIFWLIFFSMFGAGSRVAAQDNDCASRTSGQAWVILLHGMGRTSHSMASMADHLAGQGYTVVNLDYPSRKKSVEALSAGILTDTVDRCRVQHPHWPIHFVTHSLGGIVVRHFLQTNKVPAGSRMVMLSPPNQGSEVADMLKENWFYRKVMGPAGQQLGTGADALPNRMDKIQIPVGVITGDRSLNPWFSARLPGPDDGKVSVARAKLAEMADFLVVHRSHAFIMGDREVMEQTLFFLRHGRFDKDVKKKG